MFARIYLLIFLMLPNIGHTAEQSTLGANQSTPPSFQEYIYQHVHEYLDNKIKSKTLEESQTFEKIEYDLGKLDARLKMPKCSNSLDIQPMHQKWLKANASFRIKCQQPGWAVVLPVKFRAYADTWFSTQSLPRGHIIQPQDIKKTRIDLLQTYQDFFSIHENLIGREVTRNISAHKRFSQRLLKIPSTIQRNQTVDIIAKSDKIHIRSKGVALENGKLGEQIRVKNIKSNRIIKARVKSTDRVEIAW